MTLSEFLRWQRRMILFTSVLAMGTLGCIFTMMGGTTPSRSFSTEPWVDPWYCSTDWYPFTLGYGLQRGVTPAVDAQEVMRNQIDREPIPMLLNRYEGMHSGNGRCGQEEAPLIMGVHAQFTVPELAMTDADIGARVRVIVEIIRQKPDVLSAGPGGVLQFWFYGDGPDIYAIRWALPYNQALQAIDAGLSDTELFLAGSENPAPPPSWE